MEDKSKVSFTCPDVPGIMQTLKKIAEYFHVTTDYLLDYSAGTCNDSRDQIILQVFHSLTEEQKDIYIEQRKVFIKSNLNRKGIVSAQKSNSKTK